MKKIVVGIDPGAKGALATIVDGDLAIWDLKDCMKQTGSFRSLDPVLFNQLIGSAIDDEYSHATGRLTLSVNDGTPVDFSYVDLGGSNSRNVTAGTG